MALVAAKKERCRACLNFVALRKDGTFRRHNRTDFGITYECQGSHKDWIYRVAQPKDHIPPYQGVAGEEETRSER